MELVGYIMLSFISVWGVVMLSAMGYSAKQGWELRAGLDTTKGAETMKNCLIAAILCVLMFLYATYSYKKTQKKKKNEQYNVEASASLM
ncbi:hypothetical protein PCE1_000411 [Barthelona sp. PCE]